MSQLIDLIDDYKARHGQPSDASIARAIGVAPQTVNSWRKRGLRDLPDRDTLHRLATLLVVDYSTVLGAVLADIGYIEDAEQTPPQAGRRFGT